MLDIFQGTGTPLSRKGFDTTARRLGVDADCASLWALMAVETRGFGYLADKRPKILFERHVFHARTGGMFGAANPDISNPHPGGYGTPPAEYQRLKRAMVLDRRRALESASWGIGQIMGFNAAAIGYDGVEHMIDAFRQNEDLQLDAAASFIIGKPALLQAFKARDWARVAFFYNGKDYAINAYDRKLANSYARFSVDSGMPDIDVRAAQARLGYIGFDTRGVDGIMGDATVQAVVAFQKRSRLTPSGSLDPATRAELARAVGA